MDNPNIVLEVTVEDTNKIITGLNYYKKDLDELSQKIIADAQTQIAKFNEAVTQWQAEQQQEQEKKVKEEKKGKKEE